MRRSPTGPTGWRRATVFDLRTATESSQKYAPARDAVAAMMTVQQIAESQRLAREWKPTPDGVAYDEPALPVRRYIDLER
jgi:hypothetical protein